MLEFPYGSWLDRSCISTMQASTVVDPLAENFFFN